MTARHTMISEAERASLAAFEKSLDAVLRSTATDSEKAIILQAQRDYINALTTFLRVTITSN